MKQNQTTETVDTMETVLFTNLSAKQVSEAKVSATIPFLKLIATVYNLNPAIQLKECTEILFNSVIKN